MHEQLSIKALPWFIKILAAVVGAILALVLSGENNLFVKLADSNGAVYWGCHSWWKPEDYATFTDYGLRSALIPVDLQPALEHLYERL